MRLEIKGSPVFVGTGSTRIQAHLPTIVFLHGAGMDHSVWLMPARYFARRGFNVVAPDFPQHGQSQGNALESVEAMAEWVVPKSMPTILLMGRACIEPVELSTLPHALFGHRRRNLRADR